MRKIKNLRRLDPLDSASHRVYFFFGIRFAIAIDTPVAYRIRAMRPSPLFKEITLVLVIKVALLFGLWAAFFSEPVGDDLTAGQVEDAVFGTAEARRYEVEKGETDGR
ncbi:MAG TPA: hypothetical protein VKA64_11635 [Gammaproteobacteria bacterium]|nr:hypothetical protein [Gammaproteobacteria bacterium]